jgi:thymidylate synthase
MIAHVTGLKVGEFVHTLGDAHLYLNHLEQVELQLSRAPKALPRLDIKRDIQDIEAFRFEDFEIVGYAPEAAISAPVAV